MTTFFSRLNPKPSFPAYTGPHRVGSIDVEIPTTDLGASPSAPDSSLTSVSFRIFYPCEDQSKSRAKRTYWVPDPQRDYLGAYARFLGAGNRLAGFFS